MFSLVYHKDRNIKNNNLSNLITLCLSCHSKEHLHEKEKGRKNNQLKRLFNIGFTIQEIQKSYPHLLK